MNFNLKNIFEVISGEISERAPRAIPEELLEELIEIIEESTNWQNKS